MEVSANFHKSIKYFSITAILFCLGFLFNSQLVFAQLSELEVTTAEKPDAIPVFTENPEEAAIIITSSLTNLNFGSNVGLVDNKSRPNEGYYVLLIRPWRQIITVNLQGYRQARFTIPATEKREVLYYNIEPKDTDRNLIPTNIIITHSDGSTSNSNVILFIDDQQFETNTSTYQLSPGVHQVRIEEAGYKTISSEIDVSINNTLFQFNLIEQQLELVSISTNPGDASVFIDNINRGQTTYKDFLFPGEYFLQLIRSDYKTIETQIIVKEGINNEFDFEMQRHSGQLQLSVTPSNARVLINRQNYTGQTNITLAPGRYRIEIESAGYDTYSEQFELGENEQITKSIALTAKTGDLQFALQPSSANVILYDHNNLLVQRWEGANLVRDLPVGTYHFTATHPEYQTLSEEMVINSNERTIVNYRMTALSEIEREALARQEEAEKERQRIAGEQQRKQAQEAEQERKRQEEFAARQRKRQFIRYPSFGGVNIFLTNMNIPSTAFENNVEEKFGIGIGFFSYSNYKTFSFDFIYSTYTLFEDVKNYYGIENNIESFSINGSFSPTLPLGPLLIAAGMGIDYTQYYSGESAFYTTDTFYKIDFTLKPRSWSIGFMLDLRGSMDLGLFENYYPWKQTNLTLVWAF